MMNLFVKNTAGKPSASLTIGLVAFVATLVWFILSMFQVPHVKAFDSGDALAFLMPCLSLYFGRRLTDARAKPQEGT